MPENTAPAPASSPADPDTTARTSSETTRDAAKIRVALVFGGRSAEHEVSCATAASVLEALDRDRYDVIPVGIARDGHWVLAGNKKLMDAENVNMYQNGEGDGKFGTVVYIAVDGKFRGLLVISDEVKPTSKQAIINLIVQGVHTVMLTGDSPRVGEYVAKELGVQEVHGGLLPADKVEWVEKLLAAKRPRTELAFVGDGINDAPVLMRADIGIAMGALGSDAAIEAADIVLMDDDPAKISLAMRISRKCMRIVYQNIVFALAVKALCLILTALGITNMWWGVFADVGVMILAVLNATRMLNVKEYQ